MKVKAHLVKVLALALCLALCLPMLSAASFAAPTAVGTIAGDFADPPSAAKPSIRYWLPAAMVQEDTLRADLQDIAALGYGTVEVCSLTFFTANIEPGYEWGTDNWDKAMHIIVDEAQKLGLNVDFTNGDAYPIRMPSVANADDEGSSYEITFGQHTLAAGETYNAALPARRTIRVAGTPKLLSAYAYKVAGEKLLELDSAVNLMPYITVDEAANQNSTLNWTAPDDGDYELFFFFEQPTAHTDGSFNQGETGPYVVDHFGLAGAQACIDYWTGVFEKDPSLTYVSNIFSDSIEIFADNEWTRGFETIFEELKGYDIRPYLPTLGYISYYNSVDGPGYSFTDSKLTSQVRFDYNDVLTYCFENYHLKPLQAFAESMGMDARYQVAYNIPTDIVGSALHVAIPEIEGTSFDQLRLMASAVHMRENPLGLYSMEIGFENNNTYGQTYEDLLWRMKRAWAAGINKPYLHGASYSGNWNGPIMTFPPLNDQMFYWPGYHAWSIVVSNVWNRNTSTENARAVIDYMARTNYVMQKTQKVDLAVFREVFDGVGDGPMDGADYQDGGLLNSLGYSYEFLDTEILELDTAVVTNGVLNEAGPAYKAIILSNQNVISYQAAADLAALAEAGLPIIIVGNAPSSLMYLGDQVKDGHTDTEIADIFAKLLAKDTVKQVANYSDVPAALAQVGVYADAAYANAVDILAKHTTDGTGEYYYFYNYSRTGSYPNIDKTAAFSEKDVVVTLQGQGKPYYMNAWTGEIVPIAEYTTNADGTVTVPLHFGEDEAKLIVLLTDNEATANGIKPLESAVTRKDGDDAVEAVDGKLVLKATSNGSTLLHMDNGRDITVTAENVQPEIAINEWKLSINSIHQGDTLYFRDSKWTQLDTVIVNELKSWDQINPDWKNISGIGTYTATFELDNGWDEGHGAYISIGEVTDTYTLTVNGVQLPTVDQIAKVIDIGPYVQAGENTVVIKVATTLYNAVNGDANANDANAGYGLLGINGKVIVTPYAAVEIAKPTLDNTPPTGDNSQMALWVTVMALSLTGMVLLCIPTKKLGKH